MKLPVRPTSRGYVVFVLGVVWFMITMVHQTLFAFVFACAAVALTIASFVGALFSLRGVKVARAAVGDAEAGHVVSMPVLVSNGLRRRRQPLVISESCGFAASDPHVVVVPSLGGREERVVNRRMLAMKRGEFDLDALTLRSGDPAGLFVRERSFSCPRSMLVMPGVEPLTELELAPRSGMAATDGNPVSAAGTSQEFFGIREYNPTDGMRHIHWRASARFGKLMVREFERNAVMSVAILLDAFEEDVSGAEHWSNLEYQVRAAASICSHVAGLYCNLAFCAGGERIVAIPPGPAAEAEKKLLYTLATLKAGPVRLADAAFVLGDSLPRDTSVYCLSLGSSRSTQSVLEVFCAQGMTVRWLCARREAFAARSGSRGRSQAPLPGKSRLVDAAELHPGMQLTRALSLATS
ncbi:MAG: DUF58 domain-containing protein [Lentisphaerae bacterium]|nr:DUF58 domain-containing protein [Lentisphaerota bacterium]MBT4817782.1 DUF58 domain-containing protein [Lentisphaerota bacterium]MBT5612795.1 DUF58 domain-containing protein [Lentisphaerota bacterium]MBT7057621.1 DUF58 domain-containing protein [Lentisphaerota bacterium]MBT7844932.1 DUF58 domain-containing protein [Lentisphaerota bacterium]